MKILRKIFLIVMLAITITLTLKIRAPSEERIQPENMKSKEVDNKASYLIYDKSIVYGQEVINIIEELSNKKIQFTVITNANGEGVIYNWNHRYEKKVKTYDKDTIKKDNNYINPQAAFETSVTLDKENNIVAVLYEQNER